jgi:HPt (histidine-containing phosphotransfer) domain-containing protein
MIDMNIFNDLKNLLGDDFNLLLEKYLENSQTLMSDVENALEKDDKVLLGRSLHSLKSSSAQVGAVTFSDKMLEYEGYVHKEDLEHLKKSLDEMKEFYQEVRKEIENLINK